MGFHVHPILFHRHALVLQPQALLYGKLGITLRDQKFAGPTYNAPPRNIARSSSKGTTDKESAKARGKKLPNIAVAEDLPARNKFDHPIHTVPSGHERAVSFERSWNAE